MKPPSTNVAVALATAAALLCVVGMLPGVEAQGDSIYFDPAPAAGATTLKLVATLASPNIQSVRVTTSTGSSTCHVLVFVSTLTGQKVHTYNVAALPNNVFLTVTMFTNNQVCNSVGSIGQLTALIGNPPTIAFARPPFVGQTALSLAVANVAAGSSATVRVYSSDTAMFTTFTQHFCGAANQSSPISVSHTVVVNLYLLAFITPEACGTTPSAAVTTLPRATATPLRAPAVAVDPIPSAGDSLFGVRLTPPGTDATTQYAVVAIRVDAAVTTETYVCNTGSLTTAQTTIALSVSPAFESGDTVYVYVGTGACPSAAILHANIPSTFAPVNSMQFMVPFPPPIITLFAMRGSRAIFGGLTNVQSGMTPIVAYSIDYGREVGVHTGSITSPSVNQTAWSVESLPLPLSGGERIIVTLRIDGADVSVAETVVPFTSSSTDYRTPTQGRADTLDVPALTLTGTSAFVSVLHGFRLNAGVATYSTYLAKTDSLFKVSSSSPPVPVASSLPPSFASGGGISLEDDWMLTFGSVEEDITLAIGPTAYFFRQSNPTSVTQILHSTSSSQFGATGTTPFHVVGGGDLANNVVVNPGACSVHVVTAVSLQSSVTLGTLAQAANPCTASNLPTNSNEVLFSNTKAVGPMWRAAMRVRANGDTELYWHAAGGDTIYRLRMVGGRLDSVFVMRFLASVPTVATSAPSTPVFLSSAFFLSNQGSSPTIVVPQHNVTASTNVAQLFGISSPTSMNTLRSSIPSTQGAVSGSTTTLRTGTSTSPAPSIFITTIHGLGDDLATPPWKLTSTKSVLVAQGNRHAILPFSNIVNALLYDPCDSALTTCATQDANTASVFNVAVAAGATPPFSVNASTCTWSATDPLAQPCACPAGGLVEGIGSISSPCTDVNECVSNNGGCRFVRPAVPDVILDLALTCANNPAALATCTCTAGQNGMPNGTRCVETLSGSRVFTVECKPGHIHGGSVADGCTKCPANTWQDGNVCVNCYAAGSESTTTSNEGSFDIEHCRCAPNHVLDGDPDAPWTKSGGGRCAVVGLDKWDPGDHIDTVGGMNIAFDCIGNAHRHDGFRSNSATGRVPLFPETTAVANLGDVNDCLCDAGYIGVFDAMTGVLTGCTECTGANTLSALTFGSKTCVTGVPSNSRAIVSGAPRVATVVIRDGIAPGRVCLEGYVPVTSTTDFSGTCVPCAAGTYSDTAGLTASCAPCNAGRYSAIVGASSNTSCIDCPVDTFSNLAIASSSTLCKPCGAGSTTPAGSASCSCGDAGFILSGTSGTCIECAAGHYEDGANNTCKACATNITGFGLALIGDRLASSADCVCDSKHTRAATQTSGTPDDYLCLETANECLLYLDDPFHGTSNTNGVRNPCWVHADDPTLVATCAYGNGALTCECPAGYWGNGRAPVSGNGCTPLAKDEYHDLATHTNFFCNIFFGFDTYFVPSAGQCTCDIHRVAGGGLDIATGRGQPCAPCANLNHKIVEGNNTNITGETMCVPCGTGMRSVAGDRSQCECAPGYYDDDGDPATLTCTLCSAKKFCTGGTATPQDCIINAYCPAGSSAPTACPQTATSAVRSDDVTDCTCPEGTHRVAQNSSGVTTYTCGQCLAGSYAAAGDPACTPCAAGTYASAAASALCSPCTTKNTYCPLGAVGEIPCPRYSTAPVGSIALVNCTCEDMRYLDTSVSPTACSLCATGTAGTGGTCTDCVAGKYASSTGASSCSDCPVDTFCPGTKTVTPTECPTDSTTLAHTNRDSVDDCTCNDGKEKFVVSVGALNTTSCRNCPVGTAGTGGVCTPCAAGTYADTPGLSACRPCTEHSYCPGTANTAATPCPNGATSDASSDSITDCLCPIGQQLIGTQCLDCPAGSYGAARGLCVGCALGTYASTGGSTQCTNCAVSGYELRKDATTPSRVNATTCTQCAAGRFSAPGDYVCSACPAAKYSSAVGASSCASCTNGMTLARTGGIHLLAANTVCEPCDGTSFSTADASSCVTLTCGGANQLVCGGGGTCSNNACVCPENYVAVRLSGGTYSCSFVGAPAPAPAPGPPPPPPSPPTIVISSTNQDALTNPSTPFTIGGPPVPEGQTVVESTVVVSVPSTPSSDFAPTNPVNLCVTRQGVTVEIAGASGQTISTSASLLSISSNAGCVEPNEVVVSGFNFEENFLNQPITSTPLEKISLSDVQGTISTTTFDNINQVSIQDSMLETPNGLTIGASGPTRRAASAPDHVVDVAALRSAEEESSNVQSIPVAPSQ